MRVLLGKVASGLAGAAVALVLIHFFRPHTQVEELQEITIGVVAALYISSTTDALRLSKRISDADRRTDLLLQIAETHGATSAIMRLYLTAGDIYTEPAGFPTLFLNVLGAIEKSYYTTFVASEAEASFAHNEVALATQQSKALVSNADIRRLFICRDAAEASALFATMREQIRRGIKVRYILRAKIRSHQLLREWTRKVDGLDFAIMDNALILYTDIDPRSYKIKGARLSVDSQRREQLERFYADLWREATEPPNH